MKCFVENAGSRRAPTSSTAQHIKKDFFQSLLQVGRCIPCEAPALLAIEDDPGASAAESAYVRYSNKFTAFEVLDNNPTGSVNAVKPNVSGMVCPWLVGLYTVSASEEAPDVPTNMTLAMSKQEPGVMDAISLASFVAARDSFNCLVGSTAV